MVLQTRLRASFFSLALSMKERPRHNSEAETIPDNVREALVGINKLVVLVNDLLGGLSNSEPGKEGEINKIIARHTAEILSGIDPDSIKAAVKVLKKLQEEKREK